MKNTAILVNCGRGDTVDTDALVTALQASTGGIAGAVLDVVSPLASVPCRPAPRLGRCADVTCPWSCQTEPEPLPDGHVLFDLPNVILTPHCSWASEVNFHRATDLLEQNVARFAAGDQVLNVLRSQAQ